MLGGRGGDEKEAKEREVGREGRVEGKGGETDFGARPPRGPWR